MGIGLGDGGNVKTAAEEDKSRQVFFGGLGKLQGLRMFQGREL